MAGPNVGYAAVSIIPSARGFQAALSSQVTGPANAVGAQAGKSMGGKMAGAVGTVMKGAFAGGLIGVGAVAGLAKLGSSFDEAFDTIRVGTGATGEALEGLQGSFKNVFSSVPTDMTSASTAIADLNTRLGLTGGHLEARSKQILELSRITGTDLAQNIESVTRVFGDWGITVDDQGERMDQLFRASQATGLGVDVLGRQMVQFGAPLRQLGFDFETSAGLLGKFEKEGVNAELVMGSLRIALGKMAREGEPAEETLKRVTEEIANAGDASTANALALELFGARAGPDMAAAIREGRFELGDLYDTISSGSETILGAAEDTNDWQQSWERLKNQTLVLMEPLATRVFTALGTGMDWVSEKAPVFAAWFSRDIWPALQNVAAVVTELVRDGFGALSSWWDQHGETIRDGLASIGWVIIDPVIASMLALWETVRDKVIPAFGDIISWIQGNRTALYAFGAFVGTILVGHFVKLTAATVAQTAANIGLAVSWIAAAGPLIALAALIAGSVGLFIYLWENVDGLKRAIGFWALGMLFAKQILLDIIEVVKDAIRWIGELIDRIGDINIPKLPGLGGGFGVSDALKAIWDSPVFDSGGVMPGPRGEHNLAWVAGGETVLPTHKDDFSVAMGGSGVTEEIRALGDRIQSMEVVIGRQRVGRVVRSEETEYARRNG